jgi:hypothetical protein
LVGEFVEVLGSEQISKTIQKGSASSVGAEWVVDGKKKTIETYDIEQTLERRLGEIAARGEMNVGLKVGGHWLPQVARG